MKLLPLLCGFVLVVSPVFGNEPPAIDKIVSKLQEAKASTAPLPLLEKAKEELNKYHPAPSEAKETLAGRGPKKKAAANVEAHEMKGRAEKALQEAIEAAKSGAANVGEKIDAAIAEVHHVGNEKHL